jgi:hypothetical protein
METNHSDSVTRMKRREFIRTTALGTAALAVPGRLLADPYAPLPSRLLSARPVRVRGQVRNGASGVGEVGVSDGLAVVKTAADGTFELVTTSERPYLFCCVPSGYEIPTSATGTANCYRPIQPDSRGEMDVVFDLTRRRGSDSEHAVLLLADPQTQDDLEMRWLHEQTVPDIRALLGELGQTESFGIGCGDIMYDNLEFFPEYERAVSRMCVPFFQVVGNHDLDQGSPTDEGSVDTFSGHFGPRYYSFERGEVHYVVLDDVFWYGSSYLGYLDADQLSWLEADLTRIEPGRTVVVATHIPVAGSRHTREGKSKPDINMSVANREALYRQLEPYNAHILVGHTHESEHLFEGGVHEHVCGAVCGAWWSGPICGDGTPKGYALYEIQGSEVTWRYKSTGHGLDHQIRAYPIGVDPGAPDEIVANVWDWDPKWTVVWYEDGERKGAMARRVAHDPQSVKLHTGPDLPPRRKWVEPYPTGHLFYAPASRTAREIRVEATDRFGRVYSVLVPRSA